MIISKVRSNIAATLNKIKNISNFENDPFEVPANLTCKIHVANFGPSRYMNDRQTIVSLINIDSDENNKSVDNYFCKSGIFSLKQQITLTILKGLL